MKSNFEQRFLKYFCKVCALSGLVLFKVNYSEKRVQISFFQTLYSSFWFLLFAINYRTTYFGSFQGLEDLFQNEEFSNIDADVEFFVSFSMTILFALISLRNFKSTKEFFTKLIKVSNIDGFDHKLSWHMCGVIAFGETSLLFVYFTNLLWFSWGGWEKILTINLWENKIINCYVVVMPVSLAGRCSISFTLMIDFVRQLVVLLNHRIGESLKLAESSENFKNLEVELEHASQLYIEISSIIKLFEESFGPIIVVLQCAALIIGVNQVVYFPK